MYTKGRRLGSRLIYSCRCRLLPLLTALARTPGRGAAAGTDSALVQWLAQTLLIAPVEPIRDDFCAGHHHRDGVVAEQFKPGVEVGRGGQAPGWRTL